LSEASKSHFVLPGPFDNLEKLLKLPESILFCQEALKPLEKLSKFPEASRNHFIWPEAFRNRFVLSEASRGHFVLSEAFEAL